MINETEPVESTLAPTSTTEGGTTKTAPGSAPDGLRGRWSETSLEGEPADLTLNGVNYTAVLGQGNSRAEGAGRFFVGDDKTIVVIKPSPFHCVGEGKGTHLWSVEDEVLRFELVGVDECGPRPRHLTGIEYTLVDHLDY